MAQNVFSIITGSGSYIPTRTIRNKDFRNHVFMDPGGIRLAKDNDDIIRQFEQITGIIERRYVTEDMVTSDIAFLAAREALYSAQTDAETIDCIIVAHNFGDIREENRRSEMVPSLAARVKHHLGIRNPRTVAYDLPFGCAGWLQGVIQADYYIRSGSARKVLIIGAETLSRVCDPHDRDSMIYADGAGALIIEATESTEPTGILAHSVHSYAHELAYLLQMAPSYNPAYRQGQLFLKMQGRKLYEYALKTVPLVMKECLDAAGLSATDIKKVLIHQANSKMDEAILKQWYELYGANEIPEGIMPMTISWLGNSSVATLPTLYDLLSREKIEGQRLETGSYIVFAAVGAGVNVNAVAYKVPAAR